MLPTASRGNSGQGGSRERHGLFVLYPEKETQHVDIDMVVLHGLGGDAYKTWTADNKKMWPRDFIPMFLPKARVMTFGYDSKPAFSPSTADIQDFASDLLTRLRNNRWSIEAMTGPIIFICHSLGGIVCKKALIMAKEKAYYSNIFQKTQAILFFGCPHRGSRVASWGTVMSNFINTCSLHKPLRKELLKDLSRSSELLAEVSLSFKFAVADIQIKTFYETEMMLPLKGPVVERESALLGITNEQAIPIAADHREMVRFSDFESQKFESVRFALKELVEGAPMDHFEASPFFLQKELEVTAYHEQLTSIQNREPETCNWILEQPSFQDWAESRKSNILWLRGHPGVGKTVLTKHLITSVLPAVRVVSRDPLRIVQSEKGPRDSFLAYFLCSDKDSERQSGVNILKSLLHQMIIAEPDTFHSLKPFVRKNDTKVYTFLSDPTLLWDALRITIIASKRDTIYLVLDALDEMEVHGLTDFTLGLRKLADGLGPYIEPRRLKILVTSRPNPDLDTTLESPSIAVRSERDVQHYIENAIQRSAWSSSISNETKKRIMSAICEKAGSMFLWARLAWEQFCQEYLSTRCIEDSLRIIHRLPPTLHSLYEDILNRQDIPSMALLKRIFEWISLSSRPLDVRELRFAVGLCEGVKSLAELQISSQNGFELETICPAFLKVDASGNVQFVHQSIKDFLLSPDTKPQYRVHSQEAHTNLAKCCLRCFTLRGFDGEAIWKRLVTREPNNSEEFHNVRLECELLLYVSQNWPYHVKRASNTSEVCDAFRTFCDCSESLSLWMLLYLYDGSLIWQQGWHKKACHLDRTVLPPALHIAVYLDLRQVIERLVSSGANPNEVYSMRYSSRSMPEIPHGTVLHFPNLGSDLFKYLVDHGADVSKVNLDGHSPFAQAIRSGNESHCIMILDAMKDKSFLNAGSGLPRHFLLEAMDRQMGSVITRILDEPSLDLVGKNMLTVAQSAGSVFVTSPLEYACLYGPESLARLLMEHPRMVLTQQQKDLDFAKQISLTFLSVLQGWESLTVTAMLQFCTDLETEIDKDKRTILHHAVMEHWHEVLETCISRMRSVKLNMIDKNGMTPLHLAASSRNWYAATKLLDGGAQPGLKDIYGRTPAHVAAEHGSERVLRIMLERGAVPVHEFDYKKRTILHYVATWNLSTIAEALVTHTELDVKAKDCDGRTAAHMAALFGSSAVLAVLLGTKLIHINARDTHGNSLLHSAVESKVESCIQELVWRDDLDINLLNRYGKSALDITFGYKDSSESAQVRALLESAGCSRGLWRPPRRPYMHGVKTTEDGAREKEMAQHTSQSWAIVLQDKPVGS